MTGLQKHAYWIHQKIEDKNSVTGFIYARQCTCSSCGYEANMEKDECPHCHAVMDEKEPAAKHAGKQ